MIGKWILFVRLNWQGDWYRYDTGHHYVGEAWCEIERQSVEDYWWDLGQGADPPVQGISSECEGPYFDM